MRSQIAFASGLGSDAPPLLLAAAQRLEPFDMDLARETYLTAWGAAMFAAEEVSVTTISRAAGALPPPEGAPRAIDLVLEGSALLITGERAAAVAAMKRAAVALANDVRRRTCSGGAGWPPAWRPPSGTTS